jgi:hypothetical protein
MSNKHSEDDPYLDLVVHLLSLVIQIFLALAMITILPFLMIASLVFGDDEDKK